MSAADLPTEMVLARAVRDVAEFTATQDWGQAPQIFALVPTQDLLAAEPGIADQIDPTAELTPIAQDPLPEHTGGATSAVEEFLATTRWPDPVAGCVLAQEIMVLPPEAENTLDEALTPLLADHAAADAAARQAAQAHPERRDARLFVAALRTGGTLSLLYVRPDTETDTAPTSELRTADNLAPNLSQALQHTFD